MQYQKKALIKNNKNLVFPMFDVPVDNLIEAAILK